MTLTIGIKALNEEAHIADALASAVAAVARVGGEVVLADSGSTDRTLDIARTFPVRVVGLQNVAERCCGAGAQLAFQHADGEYFYLLDGDMVLNPDFVTAGIAYLEANPQVAGVGGRVREVNVANAEFQIRAATVRADRNWLPGEVDRLDCGGLYRMSALRALGYFADRNLHSFEEFELGARLRAHGWKLVRIDVPAVDHFGHSEEGYRLLWRRLKSGYAGGAGEVLRAAVGAPHFALVLRGLGHVRNGLSVMLWWILLVVAVLSKQWWALAVLVALPIGWLWYKRGRFGLAIYSFVSWNCIALGLITGFFRRRRPPTQAIAAVMVQNSPPGVAETG